MLLKITAIVGLALCAQLAQAAQAGKVIFVAGQASLVDRQAAEGAAVQEGDMLQTGADGFLYVKTVDNGLFILRPNTKARIVTYHIDPKNAANNRIKLELISGVARSKSGDAVKLARQNFRFNTPVAAIGVRGTDFTVFTDNNTSRVSVISGGVVVSGFEGACRPEGSGPCEGTASRELSASQRGQLLQIKRGGAAPQLLKGGVNNPEQQPLPSDAPLAAGGAVVVTTDAIVSAQKADSINKATAQLPGATPAPPVVLPPITTPAPPPVTGVPPVIAPPVAVQQAGILWGRWQRVLGPAPDFNLTLELAKHELVSVNGNFAVFRTAGQQYVSPERGGIGFSLADSEAFVYTSYGSTSSAAAAKLTNGRLDVDFGSKAFITSFDLTSKAETMNWYATGVVGGDGRLYGDLSEGRQGFLNVQGLLSNDKGGTAAYVFDGRIDAKRTVNGVTYWRK